ELERTPEDPVPHVRVRLGPVPDREVVAERAADRLGEAEHRDPEAREPERAVASAHDPRVDPVPDEERRADRGRLPGEARGAGAAIVDVGGESTRPGSDGIGAEEELARIEPVLADLNGAPLSVDTSKAAVAKRAVELGAELVNDVTALRGDPELAGVVADGGCYLCLMHMQGEPRTMQDAPRYDDVVSDVKRFLEERLAFAVAAGV